MRNDAVSRRRRLKSPAAAAGATGLVPRLRSLSNNAPISSCWSVAMGCLLILDAEDLLRKCQHEPGARRLGRVVADGFAGIDRGLEGRQVGDLGPEQLLRSEGVF